MIVKCGLSLATKRAKGWLKGLKDGTFLSTIQYDRSIWSKYACTHPILKNTPSQYNLLGLTLSQACRSIWRKRSHVQQAFCVLTSLECSNIQSWRVEVESGRILIRSLSPCTPSPSSASSYLTATFYFELTCITPILLCSKKLKLNHGWSSARWAYSIHVFARW